MTFLKPVLYSTQQRTQIVCFYKKVRSVKNDYHKLRDMCDKHNRLFEISIAITVQKIQGSGFVGDH